MFVPLQVPFSAADDACTPKRHSNRHSGGANFAFLDGHVKWYRPDGPPFRMPINGMDYDGDGLVGEGGIMR